MLRQNNVFTDGFKKLKNVEYLTTDLFSPLADVKADICNLPFEDNSYDVVFCNHVLEHIDDDAKAMKELYRVMKPGGLGVFQVPQDTARKETYEDSNITSSEERKVHFGQYDHVRVYGMDYFDRLRAVGFEVEEMACIEIASQKEIDSYCLSADEILPVCRKPYS